MAPIKPGVLIANHTTVTWGEAVVIYFLTWYATVIYSVLSGLAFTIFCCIYFSILTFFPHFIPVFLCLWLYCVYVLGNICMEEAFMVGGEWTPTMRCTARCTSPAGRTLSSRVLALMPSPMTPSPALTPLCEYLLAAPCPHLEICFPFPFFLIQHFLFCYISFSFFVPASLPACLPMLASCLLACHILPYFIHHLPSVRANHVL